MARRGNRSVTPIRPDVKRRRATGSPAGHESGGVPPGQVPVTIVRRIDVIRHRVTGKGFGPLPAGRFVGVVAVISPEGFVGSVADQIELAGSAGHLVVPFQGALVEGDLPEVAIEFQVAEVIGMQEEGLAAGQSADDFPELVIDGLLGEIGGRRELDSETDELPRKGGVLVPLDRLEIGQEELETVVFRIFASQRMASR